MAVMQRLPQNSGLCALCVAKVVQAVNQDHERKRPCAAS